MYDTAGSTANLLPEGAVTYVSQNNRRVTMRITQLWSTESVVWIAPYYFQNESWQCPKRRNVQPGETLEYEVPCFDRVATFVVIVNDESLIEGLDLQLMDDCAVDDDDIIGKKVLYAFTAQCAPPPVECDEPIIL